MTSDDITELARCIHIPDLLPDEIMAEKTTNLSICNGPAQHSGMTDKHYSETITPIAALSTHSTLTSLPKDLPSPEASSLPDCPGMSHSTACSCRQGTGREDKTMPNNSRKGCVTASDHIVDTTLKPITYIQEAVVSRT